MKLNHFISFFKIMENSMTTQELASRRSVKKRAREIIYYILIVFVAILATIIPLFVTDQYAPYLTFT